MTNHSLTGRVTAEIEALHAEFERWFAGATDDFERIRSSMAEDFTFVSPRGDVVDAGALLEDLTAARGSRQMRIRISNVTVREAGNSTVIATYEEWHHYADYTTARQSTALLTEDEAAPRGLLWRHVHETWKLPPPDGP